MKLSIISINYNNLDGLKHTIESIKSQIDIDKNKFEYVVVDGLSNDGVKEFIEKSNIVDKYIIEKDDGIADAFNKGIKLAGAEYLYFLNSGDVFYDENSLKKILDDISNENSDIFVNKVVMVDDNSKVISIVGGKINLSQQKYRNYLPHQGMIIKKKLFETYELYDVNYRLGMDYEWLLRLLKDSDKLNIIFKDDVICKMLEGGVSQTRYIGTFMAYHSARVKNKIMLSPVSYMISLFFIVKRSIGIWSRK